jgi:hypothetical protein
MRALLETAGERLAFDCSLDWVSDLIEAGAPGELHDLDGTASSLAVCIERSRRPFDVAGLIPIARGVWAHEGEVLIENACTAGFDLHLQVDRDIPEITCRWRPPARDRAAARLLRSRFHLLARAVLMQYPALWWAGTRGRVPLHASAWTDERSTTMVTAQSGIGRSTLTVRELAGGVRTTGDNLAVGDGITLWGVVEPMRVADGPGRRMPHGRREATLPDREPALVAESLVILVRRSAEDASLTPCSAEAAARALVTSTYMAGELRRYWAFAASLAAGSGVGPPHPAVGEIAAAFAGALPCFEFDPGRFGHDVTLSELLRSQRVAQCA